MLTGSSDGLDQIKQVSSGKNMRYVEVEEVENLREISGRYILC